jgi:8-oxo-dGTP pyrophosphatase MutT (NUDIX family)
MKSSKSVSRKNYYCSNCGKYGHNMKKCDEPITSLGIIAVKFDNMLIHNNNFKKFLASKYLEIDNYNFSHIDNIDKLDIFKKNIKFLMIQRKHSLSYIEFLRGKYSLENIEHIQKLFKHMAPEEIKDISNLNFDNLWNSLWKKTSKSKAFQKEYKNSKDLFEKLIVLGELNKLLKIQPKYSSPEWGFPKGRRNLFEKNLDCAIREFEEETTIPSDKLNILNKINCVTEEYTGSNSLNYRHIYYLSYFDSDSIKDELIQDVSNYEVGKLGWFSWEEATELIRDYYTEKIKVVNQIYFLFLNLYLEYLSQEGISEYS